MSKQEAADGLFGCGRIFLRTTPGADQVAHCLMCLIRYLDRRQFSRSQKARQRHRENRRLKRLLAEPMLDVSALKDLLGKKLTRYAERCAAVEKLMADHGFSERRACRLIGVNRSAWQYEQLRGQDDAVRVRMREIANERRRFGYRRLAILLRRERKGMNLKKVYRLYHEERLTVRKRGGRKRALGMRAPMAIPQKLNQRWPLDFVSDSLACGRRFRMLNVIDDYRRECLACIVDTSLSGRRVVRELSAIAERRGLLCKVVSDHGRAD